MRLVAAVLLAACGSKPAPVAPASPIESTAQEPAPTQVEPPPVPSSDVVLGTSATHRALAWIVDVIGAREGKVTRDELAQHANKKMLGPVAGFDTFLATWAADAKGAVDESLEVDDPTYLRGYVRAGDKRWKVIFELDDEGKISFLQKDRADGG